MTLHLRTDDLEWREIDRDIVALDGRDASYLALNGSGALLWRMLASRVTSDELVQALVDAYEVEESRAAADTDAFLRTLSDRGLLSS
jgi:Coenzyme PQQ synthesis protein D (PqqD)